MALPKFKSSAPKQKALDRPWEPGDSIPAPEAIQKDSESVWALWNEAHQQHEQRFAETAPMPAPVRLSPEEVSWAATEPAFGSGPAIAPRKREKARREQSIFTLDSAMLVARRNNRVCPRPEQWTAFCALLPARKTLRGTQAPPAPPTGAAWSVTPALTKRLCFREQIEWAERAGVLEAAMAFMHSMPEEQWLHMGED
jgi:hypothetical protein